MSSTQVAAPPELTAALEALDAAVARVRALDFDTYQPAVRLRALERLETSRRHQAVASHDLIASLAQEEFAAIGGVPHKVIADWLRISCAEAR
ncbi:MAG TPA: HNH endonuclease, partial [Mycobacterium sp.]|nr:HNH endonuclease [Mycobacterium sp.]